MTVNICFKVSLERWREGRRVKKTKKTTRAYYITTVNPLTFTAGSGNREIIPAKHAAFIKNKIFFHVFIVKLRWSGVQNTGRHTFFLWRKDWRVEGRTSCSSEQP